MVPVREPPASDILVRAEEIYKHALADPVAAVPVAALVVADARRDGDPDGLVVALRAAAWVSHGTQDLRLARRLLDEAVRLADRHGLPDRLGDALMSRAAVLSELGRTDAAQRDLLRARALVPRSRRPELALQQATLLANLGRVEQAVRLLRVVVADPAAGVDERVKASNNLAFLEVQRGRQAAALLHAAAALREAPQVGTAREAVVTQTCAWVHVQAGRLAEGLALFARAGELYDVAGLPPGEHLTEYADALADLRLLPEALVAARRAAAALDGTPLMHAEAQLRVARLLLLTGDLVDARAAAARATAMLRRQGRSGWVARAVALTYEAQLVGADPLTPAQLRSLVESAATLREEGLLADAVEAYLALGRAAPEPQRLEHLRAAQRLAARGAVLTRLRGRVAGALAAAVSGDAATVLQQCRAGLDDLARHRDALPSMELRALASGHGVELGALGLRTLLPAARPAQILGWMERTRAAALAPAASSRSEIDDLVRTLRTLEAEAEAAAARGIPAPRDLRARIDDLEDRVRRATWQERAVAGTSHDAGMTVRQLRSQLDDTHLVEYAVLDGSLLAIVLDGRRARLVELGPVADVERDTDALLFALRRLARPGARGAAAIAARQAADALLARLRSRLLGVLRVPDDAPLVVVPVGALQRVPWTPLHDGPVTVAPSAAVWARTRSEPVAPTSVALVAGPGLPGAVAEVAALAELHPAARTLAPPASTADAVLPAVADTDLAHFACHGRVRADNPLFSSLLLEDGPLSVHELTTRIRAPRQVVLAACDSAVQTTYAGDEALGFVTALLANGTRGLLASAVLLPDVDTVPLARAVHAELRRGVPVADALHTARRILDLDQPGQLVVACAFQAYGGG